MNIRIAIVSLIALLPVTGANAVAPAAQSEAALPATATTYRYDAFIGQARAGTAEITVEQHAQHYKVDGWARSEGLLEALNAWRARFSAVGEKLLGVPKALRYHLFERDERKERDITVEDGEITYLKNGRLRGRLPALPGQDVLTALFVQSRCDARLELHTGRHGYVLERTDSDLPAGTDARVCEYKVTDDDADTFMARIEFSERDGHRVPVSLTAQGWLTGSLILVDAKAVQAVSETAEVAAQ